MTADWASFIGIDTEEVAADVDRLAFQIDQMTHALRRALEEVEPQLGAEVVAGARLRAGAERAVRTGRYVGSIHDVVAETGTGVMTTVLSDDPIAGVLEYGATIPAHEIEAANAHALHFLGRQGPTFAAHVDWPGAKIAGRPVIHSAFADLEPEIYERMMDVIDRFVSLGAPLDADAGGLDVFAPFARFLPGGTSLFGAVLEDLAAPAELAAAL